MKNCYNVIIKIYNNQKNVSIFDQPVVIHNNFEKAIIQAKKWRTKYRSLLFNFDSEHALFCVDRNQLATKLRELSLNFNTDLYFLSNMVDPYWEAPIISEEEKAERCLIVSLNRTRQKVYDIAFSNEWTHFITLTFDDTVLFSKHGDGGWNYDVVCQALHNYLKTLRKDFPNLQYMCVPELHKAYFDTLTYKKCYYNGFELDESTVQKLLYKNPRTAHEDEIVQSVFNGLYKRRFHFHFLFNNFPSSALAISYKSNGQVRTTKTGFPIYNVSNYHLGFSTATCINNIQATQYYITKYISKDMMCLTKGKKRYWASKNLNKPSVKNFHCSKSEKVELSKDLSSTIKSYNRKKILNVDISGYKNKIERFVVQNEELANVPCCSLDDYLHMGKVIKDFNNIFDTMYFAFHGELSPLEFVQLSVDYAFFFDSFYNRTDHILTDEFEYFEYWGILYKAKKINGSYIVSYVGNLT